MILNGNYIGEFSERKEKGEQWADMWLKHTYGDYGINDGKTKKRFNILLVTQYFACNKIDTATTLNYY